MKSILLVLSFLLIFGKNISQTVTGLTNITDTSFTTYSAYRSIIKTHPEVKIAEPFHFTAVEEKKNIVYCSPGKRALLLDAFYSKEKSKQKKTAIIIIHGGGWRSGNRTQHYPLAQSLANLGYVCFTPAYRLSTEALYPAAVYDIKDAIRWVKKNAKQFNIDTVRITVLGFSAGGQLAAFMGATNGMAGFEEKNYNRDASSAVHAVVDIDGILSFIHPESGEGDDSKKTSAATHWFGYSKKDHIQLWTQASPLTHAGNHTPPTLFINSSVDRMHAGRDDYIKILSSYNIYTEVKKFENSPHAFCLFEPWFTPTVKHIDDFLKKIFP